MCHALVAHLAQRVEGADVRPPAPSWRIAENRWSACRHGTAGTWRDVWTGRSEPTADHLHGLIDNLAPTARALGCEHELAHGHDLITRPRAAWARDVVAAAGLRGLVACLADRFIG